MKYVKKVYKKLVRDNIPDIIRAQGHQVFSTIVDSDEDFQNLLDSKLVEETKELYSCTTAESCLGEIVDIMEVMYAMAKLLGVNEEEINQMRLMKKIQRGGFEKRIYLSEVIEKHMDEGENNGR